jgi:hypothetical protein
MATPIFILSSMSIYACYAPLSSSFPSHGFALQRNYYFANELLKRQELYKFCRLGCLHAAVFFFFIFVTFWLVFCVINFFFSLNYKSLTAHIHAFEKLYITLWLVLIIMDGKKNYKMFLLNCVKRWM